MTRNWRELLSLVLVGCFFSCWPNGMVFGQGEAQSRGGIVDIEATPLVSVRIEIRASEKKIVIPQCGEYARDHFAFCFGEAQMEVLRGGRWDQAGPRKGLSATMGVDANEIKKTVVLEPGKAVYFTYSFSKEFFGIRRGEKLRFRVNAWTSSESMTSRTPETTLVSPIFDCP